MRIKGSRWSFALFVVGGLFALLSAIRYFVLYFDLDRAISYTAIGVTIMALAYLYNEQLKIKNTLTAVEDYLSDKS